MKTLGLLSALTLMLFTQSGIAGGAGGGGGGDKIQPVSYTGCPDGRRTPFTEHDGDRNVVVWRTCKDGSYYPKPKPVRIIRCKDGRTYQDLQDRNNDPFDAIKICRDGKYVDL